jgi:uncharacterized membrane protein
MIIIGIVIGIILIVAMFTPLLLKEETVGDTKKVVICAICLLSIFLIVYIIVDDYLELKGMSPIERKTLYGEITFVSGIICYVIWAIFSKFRSLKQKNIRDDHGTDTIER